MGDVKTVRMKNTMSFKRYIPALVLVFMTFTLSKAQFESGDFPHDYTQAIRKVHRLNSQLEAIQQESRQQILTSPLHLSGLDPNTLTALLDRVRQLQAGYQPDVNVSETCLNRTEHYLGGLIGGEYWALKMFDASAKIPSAILDGKFKWLGSYSECLAVDAYILYNVTNPDNTTWTADDQFGGQYCTGNTPIQLAGSQSVTLSIGVCVPSGCSEHDLKALLNTLIGTTYDIIHQNKDFFHKPLIPYISETKPDSNGSAPMEIDERTPLVHGHKKGVHTNDNGASGTMHKILLAFSLYTSGAKVLNTKQGSGALTCVNGIRFLSLSWVIWGHSYVFAMGTIENILPFTQNLMQRWTMQVLINGTFSVDSFFLLSGLLVTYLTMKEMKTGSGRFRINWGLYYFHRFWRLTPPYMLVMMAYVPTLYYWTNGPLWPRTVDGFDPDCYEAWWTHLLYLNNVVMPEKLMCMPWSWYLANDMQFFVISPLILFPLFWNELIGMGVLLATLFGTLLTTGILSNVNKIGPGVLSVPLTEDIIYFKPWTRIGPYLIGMLVGYILYVTDCKPKLNRLTALIGWMVATATALALVYGLYDVYQGHPLSNDVSAFYNAVSRTAWGACVGWVIYACCTGYGGFVNRLMSWKAFVPLSRLTYCAYLIHPIIMYVVYMGRETLIHATDVTMTFFFFGNMVAALACAFIVSLVFEAPMMGLEKAILQRRKSA
ncbi:nose resistant to fluoxetine protein 6 [Lingula anatina]|uniref:Nose resistant to fluoxetine protein 6 n=1 Tax=Lingula anatina TaxID=7574 RepID=A0A1S3J3B7_LINAN|nr:nose resistant to fluoxetine protein 6 [Lingula anatina]|eukprot:XP_013404902.2 nose resistant to fluoxetine protein 6 [Lingula anatina]